MSHTHAARDAPARSLERLRAGTGQHAWRDAESAETTDGIDAVSTYANLVDE
jgi:hypothetical protein